MNGHAYEEVSNCAHVEEKVIIQTEKSNSRCYKQYMMMIIIFKREPEVFKERRWVNKDRNNTKERISLKVLWSLVTFISDMRK